MNRFNCSVRSMTMQTRPASEVLPQAQARSIDLGLGDDPQLAATPISGVLVLDDQAAVIRRLALLVPIRAIRSDAGVVLRRDVASDR